MNRRGHGLAIVIAAATFAAPVNAQVPAGYLATPSFSDEFNGSSLDAMRWNSSIINYPSGSTWLYRNHAGNNAVDGGMLRQTTIYQDINADSIPEWTCSIVTGRHAQRFGYWEARMQIARWRYTNSNFWSSSISGVSLDGVDSFEIDAPEAWGTWATASTRTTGLYTASIIDHNSSRRFTTEQPISTPDLSGSMNIYAWDWGTDNVIRTYLNGNLMHTFTAPQVNSLEGLVPQSPILGTALWTVGLTSSNAIANGDVKLVDYVRVYQKPGWIGGGSNKSWNQVSNWGPDGVPGSGRAAILNTASATGTISLETDQPVQEVTVQGGTTGAITIAGPGRLLLGATSATMSDNAAVGGINVNVDTPQSLRISADIVAQRRLQFSNYSGISALGGTNGVTLFLDGALSAANPNTPLNVLTVGPVRFRGAISSGIGSITKGGQGTLSFHVANAFTGVIEHRNGAIEVHADGALGSSVAGINMTQTSDFGSPSLVFGDVIYTQPEPVTLRGRGNASFGIPARLGAIDLIGSAATFPGPITLADHATIASGTASLGGSLTLSGPIDVQQHVLTLDGGGTLFLSGQVRGVNSNGVGQIIKAGAGTVIMTGNNTPFKGSVIFRQGTVSINSINALGGGTGDILRFEGGTLSITAPVVTSKGGSFGLANGTINTNGHSFSITGPLAGAGGFTKTGLGTLTLSGANTYSGTTSVNSGALVFGASQLNSAAMHIGSSGTVQLAANGSRTLLVRSLSILPGGRLDLVNNAMILDYSSSSPLQTIQQMIRDGRIHSSMTTDAMRLGFAEQSSLGLSHFGGVALDSSSIIVRYTLAGDANLDGRVDFQDLLALARNYNLPSGATWSGGDFSHDGIVDFVDLLLLARFYNASIASVGVSQSYPQAIDPGTNDLLAWMHLQTSITLVPEPVLASTIGTLALIATRRSRATLCRAK